jgi:tetratricopeptide (TPR) repeat protein
MVCYLEHKYAEAEKAAEEALEFEPSLGNARALPGASLVRERQWERGIEELNQALSSQLNEPAEKTTRIELYEALSASRRYMRALEVLQPLAARLPSDPEVLYDLGQAY